MIEWTVAVSLIFGLGFGLGYLVRENISRRLREKARIFNRAWAVAEAGTAPKTGVAGSAPGPQPEELVISNGFSGI